MHNVLDTIPYREFYHKEKIILDQNPKDYLQIIIDEAKKSKDITAAAAGGALERKLNENPAFKQALIDFFVISSGVDPAAATARATWRSIPISTHLSTQPSKTSPTNFPSRAGRAFTSKNGHRRRFRNRDGNPDRMRAKVAGKSGVVKLMHATDPGQRMTFELTKWYQFDERSASAMEETSAYLKGLFRQALQGCDEADKALLLGDLDTYLASRNNKSAPKASSRLSNGWKRSRAGPRSSGSRRAGPRSLSRGHPPQARTEKHSRPKANARPGGMAPSK